MGFLNKLILLLSLAVFCISFFNRNTLIDNIPLATEISAEPEQSKLQKKSFPAEFNNHTYQVQPLYNYNLYGMVVSFRHHDGDQGLHKLSGDHLNVADLCVVWSDFSASPYLNKFDFWNGQFTCIISSPNYETWSHFNGNQLSNNHLISDNEFIRDEIQNIKVGDQIHIKGWLSSYTSDNGSRRGTSTSRSDTGNGACETIFVNEFNIIKPYNNPWRTAMYISLTSLIIYLFLYFRAPYKPYRN